MKWFHPKLSAGRKFIFIILYNKYYVQMPPKLLYFLLYCVPWNKVQTEISSSVSKQNSHKDNRMNYSKPSVTYYIGTGILCGCSRNDCLLSVLWSQPDLFKGFIRTLEKQDGLIKEFDAGIWSSLVQEVIVKSKDDIRFIFKNGFEVRV